ncbi:MAG: glycosyltransferase family A protein [archaeon]
MKPKILIGIPTCDWYDYCLMEFIGSIRALDYDNTEILFVDNSKGDNYAKKLNSLGFKAKQIPYYEKPRDKMVHSRNLLRSEFLKGEYDYMLLLDADVIVPPNSLSKLLTHNKKVITGIYYSFYKINGQTRMMPVLWMQEDEKKQLMKFFTPEEVEGSKLVEARACGTGCLLIHKSVLEQIQFRYKPEVDACDDVWFCHDIKQKGIQLYADTSIKCKHKIIHRIQNKDEWKSRKK